MTKSIEAKVAHKACSAEIGRRSAPSHKQGKDRRSPSRFLKLATVGNVPLDQREVAPVLHHRDMSSRAAANEVRRSDHIAKRES